MPKKQKTSPDKGPKPPVKTKSDPPPEGPPGPPNHGH